MHPNFSVNMNYSKLVPLWALASLLLFQCSSDKKAEDGESTSSDIENAVEIKLPLYATEHGNSGYGKVLEVKTDVADDKFNFQKEHNTEWYTFVATEAGKVSFTLTPNDESEDYDFLLYRYQGEGFAKDVIEKRNIPVRSNLAKNNATLGFTTGLLCDGQEDFVGPDGDKTFSNAIDVNKDEKYYLVIDHPMAGGKGYSIKFEYCGPGQAGTSGASVDTANSHVPPPPTIPQVAAPEAVEKPKHFVKRQAMNVRELGPDEEYYIVRPRNTVYSISTSHGMKVFDVMNRNRLTNNNVFIGQKLIVKKYNASEIVSAPPKPQPKQEPSETTPPPPPAPTPVPTPAEPKKEVAQEPATKPETPVAPGNSEEDAGTMTTRSAKPRSSGEPAAQGTLEAKNAVPDAIQKLYVYVNVVNAKNNNPISTIVQVVDGKNNKKIDRIPSNQLASVPIYAEGSKRKIFVIDAFSFRKESFDLDLDNLRNDSSASTVSIVNDTIVLNFELERYRKKDIFAAYNIFFYDDASVMLPKSKYELESLLEMLRENPRTRIKIHGHTNSGSMGKIVSLEPGDHEFFRLNAKNKESFGTAQILSKRRAESIKYYLAYHGVKDTRLEIKGWGGKKMIYEKDVPLAHKNKRVEIEILDE